MSDVALDAALEELYGSEPGEFVATRKRLVAQLRSSGDKAGAKQLQAARRPSTVAWALNQLARRQPALVEAVLARGRDLLTAQTRPTAANAGALRDAMRAHRAALSAAEDATLTILGSRANEGFRSEIVSTLRAASADDDVGARLRSGRITHEASAPGFPDSVGLTLVPEPPASPEPSPVADREIQRRPQRGEQLREREQQREREAQRRSNRALRAAARRDVASADAAAARAQAAFDRLQTQLDAAREELRVADDRSRAASEELACLEKLDT